MAHNSKLSDIFFSFFRERRVRLLLAPLACLMFAFGLSACGTNYDGLTMQSMGTPPAYRLDSGDRIAVTVFGEQNLSGEYEVDQAGIISLPLAGRIPAAFAELDD